MIRINLLPFRAARRKENVRRQISVFFLSLVLMSIGLFYYHLTLSSKIDLLNTRVDGVKKALKKNRKAAKEVDEIRRALDLLKIKMDAIETVKKRRREPIHLLDSMTGVVLPERMWLLRLTSDNKRVGLKGVALDQKTVADLMTRLETTELFTSVNLSTLKHVKMEGIGLKEFDIVCEKPQPKPPEAPGKKGKKKK
jgi:type IV pilus assembly protein PilN